MNPQNTLAGNLVATRTLEGLTPSFDDPADLDPCRPDRQRVEGSVVRDGPVTLPRLSNALSEQRRARKPSGARSR